MKRGNIFAIANRARRQRVGGIEIEEDPAHLRALANFDLDASFRAFMSTDVVRFEVDRGRDMLPGFIDALVRNGLAERISVPTLHLRSDPVAPVRGPYPLAYGEEATVGDRKLDAWIRSCLQHDECRESPEMGVACPWAEPAPLIETTDVTVQRMRPDGSVGVGSFRIPIGPIAIGPAPALTALAQQAARQEHARRAEDIRLLADPDVPEDRAYLVRDDQMAAAAMIAASRIILPASLAPINQVHPSLRGLARFASEPDETPEPPDTDGQNRPP